MVKFEKSKYIIEIYRKETRVKEKTAASKPTKLNGQDSWCFGFSDSGMKFRFASHLFPTKVLKISHKKYSHIFLMILK